MHISQWSESGHQTHGPWQVKRKPTGALASWASTQPGLSGTPEFVKDKEE